VLKCLSAVRDHSSLRCEVDEAFDTLTRLVDHVKEPGGFRFTEALIRDLRPSRVRIRVPGGLWHQRLGLYPRTEEGSWSLATKASGVEGPGGH